jgi:hypothetical protein
MRPEPYLVLVKGGKNAGPGRVLGRVPATSSSEAVKRFLTEMPIEIPAGRRLEGMAARILQSELNGTRSWEERRPGVFLYSRTYTEDRIRSCPPEVRRIRVREL